MNVIFMPFFLMGLAGVSRRLYDGGASYAHAQPVLQWNEVSSVGAWCLALAQIPFVVNFFWSAFRGRRVEANPWEATTLEWAAPSPPPHGNFPQLPRGAPRALRVQRRPGRRRTTSPQWEPAGA